MKNYFAFNVASIRSAAALLTLMGSSLAVSSPASAEPSPTFGDITTFAEVPVNPGFPEGIAVHGNRIFVSGAAVDGTAGNHQPSAIQVYNWKTGNLEQTIEVTRENLSLDHVLTNIANDVDGRIYALSNQLGLIRFKKHGNDYVQQAYGAQLDDLPRCSESSTPCTPTIQDLPATPNDIVFDAEGYAYVTDSSQATIWRYPPRVNLTGLSVPEVWFQSSDLEGYGSFPGVNGIRLDPSRENLYFVVTTTASNPSIAKIHRLRIADKHLEDFHEYQNFEAPDQLAFGADGKLYVSLVMPPLPPSYMPRPSQISVIDTAGIEERINPSYNGIIPLDGPAGIAFDSKSQSLMIANHAVISENASNFAVLKLYANDPGNPLEKPELP